MDKFKYFQLKSIASNSNLKFTIFKQITSRNCHIHERSRKTFMSITNYVHNPQLNHIKSSYIAHTHFLIFFFSDYLIFFYFPSNGFNPYRLQHGKWTLVTHDMHQTVFLVLHRGTKKKTCALKNVEQFLKAVRHILNKICTHASFWELFLGFV